MLLLLFAYLFASVDSLVTCRRCDRLNSYEQQCELDNCTGDYCFTAEYFYGDTIDSVTQMGCIVGALPSEGCRTNQYGNTMCFCATPNCNYNQTMTTEAPSRLPLQTCQPRRQDNNPPIRWRRPCAANFCTFVGSEFNISNETFNWSDSDCSMENDFDLFSTHTVFNLYPESCVLLQYGGQPRLTACYGANGIEETASFEISTPVVECYVDYFSPLLPYVQTGGTCFGQFCFISATSRGEVYRGCASLDQSSATQQLGVGYTRSYTGLEQWICDSSLCNIDLRSAEQSWPEELADYK
ncbi:unnamed protein product [Caenorhabditis auriculariae]|uniref:DUF7622 domain-containing protein n=1 Tax=Caenorhabditis auriculariae TaxID=2777116 RepID=A0A8S1HM93_9PELO|nr:unnamed protein product [Caenorhabditis auriculariae]